MTARARLVLDTERLLSPVSPLLFGGFVEHMGRCVYEGIYDPASPLANRDGLRLDVLDALRELNFRIIRYPGGNFLSTWNWRDGIGPRSERPRRRAPAWQAIETNQFGLNEFLAFCQTMKAEPMIGVNMGTNTFHDAADLVEYCNAPRGTTFGDLRAAHGYPEPHAIKRWCLGNEMDGPWQIGHMSAAEYGWKAREAARLMRLHDPTLETVLCGSSSHDMPTFPDWDLISLELAWDQVDYHSLHYYASNAAGDTASYLALTEELDRTIDTLEGVLRVVQAKANSKHRVYLSWDEWNVWYRAREPKDVEGGWQESPHLLEEIYNLEDALLVAAWLNLLVRRADVVKIACLAQAVNVLAPIRTTRDALLKQSIFYPFALFSRLAQGSALDVLVSAPPTPTARFGDVPALDVSATYDAASGACAVFVVNRSLTEPIVVTLEWPQGGPVAVTECVQLAGPDPKAFNTFEHPARVMAAHLPPPAIDGHKVTFEVPPLSFTALTARMT